MSSNLDSFGLDGSIAGLRAVNRFTEGTALPRVPEDVIEGLLERDTFALLELA